MSIAIPVLGGLGLFLYGMNLMGAGLENVAGEKLKKLIEVLTNNRIMGVIVGIVVTMIIQSSSATTVMVIGFVNAGLMNLSQAVGVIMGANLGTTITSQLIALDLTHIAPLAVAIGVAMWLISKNKRFESLAEILIGFGILFMGMDMMSSGLEPLASSQAFSTIMVKLNNPVLGIIAGIGLTTVLQSSSASIGLLQALASQGLINLNIAFPILFGDNIGTTTTALISSVGASVTAKRAAIIHFLFNLTGTLIFMTVLRKPIEFIVLRVSPNNVRSQIANAHTLFNLLNLLIQLPFADYLVRAAIKLVPGNDKEKTETKFLDSRIIETPTIALGQASKEAVRMGHIVEENLIKAATAFKEKDKDLVKDVYREEQIINSIEKNVLKFLIELSNAPLTEDQNNEIKIIINTINDVERVADHADNIAELAEIAIEEKLDFTEDAMEEFEDIYLKVLNVFRKTIESFEHKDLDLSKEIMKLEDEVNELEKKYRANHITRLNNQKCNADSGVIFLDVLSNLERISDHSVNIALYTLEESIITDYKKNL